MYGICIFLIKLSILSQYIQVFTPNNEPKTIYWTIVVLIILNFLFYLASTFVEIWSCSPIAKAWDPLVTEGHCVDLEALNVTASSVNTASDIIILVLPQFVIWRLNTNFRRKVTVSMIFFLAIL